jgi:hypothetical protein
VSICMGQARGKLNLTLEALTSSTVSIVPSNDIIAKLGSHSGTVYNIACPFHRPDICHVPMVSVCELITHCGPRPGSSDRAFTCHFTPNSIAPSVSQWTWEGVREAVSMIRSIFSSRP